MSKTNGKACILEDCGKSVRSRGLCQTHYQSAWEHVRDGQTSWEELVRLGLATKVNGNSFHEALARAREKAKRGSE